MQCARCGYENAPGQKFCGGCGATLVVTCLACGAAVIAAEQRCGTCGSALSHRAIHGKFDQPETYTPRHLAHKILTSRAAIEGERKQVTILFADLKGSLELLGDGDPEEAREVLDPILELMMDAVHAYEGTVNQVMGDGIMALFGAPLAHEDHALRACYAALLMQASVQRHAESIQRRDGLAPKIRVGLNSGEVVVRAIGSDLRMDYTAVGQTTHLAARMEQLADPGSILLTGDTLALVEGFIQVKARGPMTVKGLPSPVDTYELTGTGPVRSRLHAAAARGLSPFVGRHQELDQLLQALALTEKGHGQAVALVGEPGVGKSRLCWEVTHGAQARSWRLLETRCISYGTATPYLPVLELLRQDFEIAPSDSAEHMRAKVTERLGSIAPSREGDLAPLLGLLDVPIMDARWEHLEPDQRRQRTIDAVARLLLEAGDAHPLVVLVEDLQWIDTETQTLLDRVIERLPSARVLLLVTHRPEYEPGWRDRTYCRQLQVDPLPTERVEELLGRLLGVDSSIEPLARLLVEQAEGNPLYLEESVRSLVEANALAGAHGAYRLVQDPGALQIPPTVQAILMARIDRLAPEDKRILQAAAVVGREIPVSLLHPIADVPDSDLRASLARLQAGGFIEDAQPASARAVAFRHGLVRDVVYGTMLQERKRGLHGQLVDVLERLPNAVVEQGELLAHHAFQGRLWEKASRYLHRSGQRAIARSANRAAAIRLEEALQAVHAHPESPDMLERAVDVRLDLRAALSSLGELDAVPAQLDASEEAAMRLNDQPRLARVFIASSEYFWHTGHFKRASAEAGRALVIAERLGNLALSVLANHRMGAALVSGGELRMGEAHFRRNIAMLPPERGHERFGHFTVPLASAHSWLAATHADFGRFPSAIEHGHEAIRIAERAQHPRSTVWAHYALGWAHSVRGDFLEALTVLDRARAMVEEWEVFVMEPVVWGALGYAYARTGRLSEGLELLKRAGAPRQATGRITRPYVVLWLAEAYLLAGQLEEAHRSAQSALQEMRALGHGRDEAHALRLLGEITFQRDPGGAEAAEDLYRGAIARAEVSEMRPLVAQCQLGLGMLYTRTGAHERAGQHLTTARTMFQDMRLPFWLDRTEAALKDSPG